MTDRELLLMAARAAAIVSAALLAGCGQRSDPAGFVKATHRDLLTWGPDEHGVVCYRQQGMEGIACVKVR